MLPYRGLAEQPSATQFDDQLALGLVLCFVFAFIPAMNLAPIAADRPFVLQIFHAMIGKGIRSDFDSRDRLGRHAQVEACRPAQA